MKKQYKSLILITALAMLAVFINLPASGRVEFALDGRAISFSVPAPRIGFSLFGKTINRTFETKLGLDLQGGTQLVLDADMDDIATENRTTALESAREIIQRRVNFFGVNEAVVQSASSSESYRIIVELPGVTDVSDTVETIGQTARLEFREFRQSTPSAIPTIATTQDTGITGGDLAEAMLAFHPTTGEPVVQFAFIPSGSEKFEAVTSRLVGQPLAIFLDDIPLSWPIVTEPISHGQGAISGGFTRDEARQLALQLSAGALPVPIELVQQTSIGPTLGELSVATSIRAGIIGLVMVALFMVLYYGHLGALATIALFTYGLLSMAVFRIIPITLTLPGIAGFILSIGMAVDSNILIFERIKEELRDKQPWYKAQEIGFGKAWDSIRDANFTTLLTAFILFNPLNLEFLPVSGAVRGFALTLAIGVAIGLFTGIVVTRTLIRAFYVPPRGYKRL